MNQKTFAQGVNMRKFFKFTAAVYHALPKGSKWQIITSVPGTAYLLVMCRVLPGFRDQMVAGMEIAAQSGDPLAGEMADLLRG